MGDTARRPSRRTTPFVQDLLIHLRDTGVDGVPKPLGVDERGREVYRWIDGEAGAIPVRPDTTTDAALASLCRLIRVVHDASVGFEPAEDTIGFARAP